MQVLGDTCVLSHFPSQVINLLFRFTRLVKTFAHDLHCDQTAIVFVRIEDALFVAHVFGERHLFAIKVPNMLFVELLYKSVHPLEPISWLGVG